MYAVISLPFESRTRATLRRAEFGFLGVTVLTCRQTPRFCGHPSSTGVLVLDFWTLRGLRTSWLMVGISNEPEPAAVRPPWRSEPGGQRLRRTDPRHQSMENRLLYRAHSRWSSRRAE